MNGYRRSIILENLDFLIKESIDHLIFWLEDLNQLGRESLEILQNDDRSTSGDIDRIVIAITDTLIRPRGTIRSQ